MMMFKSSCVSRNTSVRCSEKRVFDIHVASVYSHSNMSMIIEAYQTCHPIKDKIQREACYLVFGLDEDKVEYYYPVVENMEKMYYKRNPINVKLGFFDITLFT
jgi:hypothetical protein